MQMEAFEMETIVRTILNAAIASLHLLFIVEMHFALNMHRELLR